MSQATMLARAGRGSGAIRLALMIAIGATSAFGARLSYAQVDFLEGVGVGSAIAYGASPNENASFGSSECTVPVMTADGRYVVFSSRASNLVEGDTNGASDVFLRDTQTGRTERLSVTSDNAQANDASENAAISGDGRFVVFESVATNLDAADQGRSRDIYLRDRAAGTTKRISALPDGGEPTGDSLTPTVSDDGRYVAFLSRAQGLVDGEWNVDGQGVYLRDVAEDQTYFLNPPLSDVSNPPYGDCPFLSGNGHHLAFTSTGMVSVEGEQPTNSRQHLYVVNTSTRVAQWSDSPQFGSLCAYQSHHPVLSRDGNYVLYQSRAASQETNGEREGLEICLLDRTSGIATSISDGHAGFSSPIAMSPDGSQAIFAPLSGENYVVYRWDRASGDLTLVTEPGMPGVNSPAFTDGQLGVSSNGERIAFGYASDIVPSDGEYDSRRQIGVLPTEGQGETISVSDQSFHFPGSANQPLNIGYFASAMSENARQVVFGSATDNLVPGDQNEEADYYVLDRDKGEIELLAPITTVDLPGVADDGDGPQITPDGRYVAFETFADNLGESDTNLRRDIYVQDRLRKTTTRASISSDGMQSAGDCHDPQISNDGRWVAFVADSAFGAPDFHYDARVAIRDVLEGVTHYVSFGDDNREDLGRHRLWGMSGDGRYLLVSRRERLDSPNGEMFGPFFYIFDRVEQASVSAFPATMAQKLGSTTTFVAMAKSGNGVAIQTGASLDADDHNGGDDVYFYDGSTGSTRWVSDPRRIEKTGRTYGPFASGASISSDGRYLAYAIRFRDQTETEQREAVSVFRYDALNDQVQLMSVDQQGRETGMFTYSPIISPDGEWIAFRATAHSESSRIGPLASWNIDAGTHGGGLYLSHAAGNDFSGAFYDPTHSGHGWLLEEIMQGEQRVLAASWYAYRDGEQLWMIGTAPIEGDRASVPMTLVRGGDFPPNHDAANLQTESFGTLELVLSDNNNGHASWTSTVDGLGSGEADFVRLTQVSDSSDASVPSGCTSGSWYNPAQSGHGLQIEVVDDGAGGQRMLGIWYHYLNGEPRWILGSGPVEGDHADLQMAITDGPDFPPAYDPTDLNQQPWGTLRFTVNDANHAHIDWDAAFAGYTDGSMELQRLTQLDGHACVQ